MIACCSFPKKHRVWSLDVLTDERKVLSTRPAVAFRRPCTRRQSHFHSVIERTSAWSRVTRETKRYLRSRSAHRRPCATRRESSDSFPTGRHRQNDRVQLPGCTVETSSAVVNTLIAVERVSRADINTGITRRRRRSSPQPRRHSIFIRRHFILRRDSRPSVQ